MDLITYMSICTTYLSIAIYYPFRERNKRKRYLIRVFWWIYVLYKLVKWLRRKDDEPRETD